LGIGPNPQSPIPNPQSPIPSYFCFYLKFKNFFKINFIEKINKYDRYKC